MAWIPPSYARATGRFIAYSFALFACTTNEPQQLRDAAGQQNTGSDAGNASATDGGAPSSNADADTSSNGSGGNSPDGGVTKPWPVRSSVPPPGSVFVHLFEWRWPDIARECETYLGPHGFEAVQISPPNEHVVLRPAGFPWWQRYQPVSYALESRSGTREEFIDMVERCARVGVGIYVDAVINHMSAQPSGVGSHGTRFTKYEYGDLYGPEDFHMPACGIEDSDWVNNKERVQRCELLGLSDLDTASERVQDTIAAYLSELVDIGVRGFRIDAAKHIPAEELAQIAAKVRARVGDDRAPYYYAEVFTYGGEAVSVEEYLALENTIGAERAAVIEFRFSRIGDYFLNRGDANLSKVRNIIGPDAGFVASERAVVFVDNHDTQREDGLSYQDGALFDLGVITMLAAPYGYPALMSGYAFERPSGRDRGPPSDPNGNTMPLYVDGASEPTCATELVPAPSAWVCEHRRPYVPGMLAFRKATVGAPLSRFWDNGKNQIAFAREAKGFVAVNAEASELSHIFDTGLPEGAYCDVTQSPVGSNGCPGRVIQVDAQGRAQLTLLPYTAAAIYVGAHP